ncbi:hypothetical protein B0T24DRAFT_661235 [Lasiosphaeria ovina]|uniref:Nudix hydrolase domain-containing protein n=1 Tax=Lasiosphaeria ovina TaxID=92902 RepID=A0AAE0TX04_9PEZI|nr:hypothetical protein B0T24DRAFT_661235 [Lasiosphaeria ovina]
MSVAVFRENGTISSFFDFVATPKKELRLKRALATSRETCKTAFAEMHAAVAALEGTPFGAHLRLSGGAGCSNANPRGLVTTGVHLNIYTANKHGEIKLWVARRGQDRANSPSMLDQCVAGGMETGDDGPLAALRREAREDAGLVDDLLAVVEAAGTVSFSDIAGDTASCVDRGRPAPGARYVFDLEVPEDMQLRPNEAGIAGFELMGLEEARRALLAREFKPNCGLVMLDFLVRKVAIAADYPQYEAIVEGLHRYLPFSCE